MELDNLAQSIDAVSDILKLAVEQSTDLADKLIRLNAENAIEVVRDEMIGQAIDILV